MTREAGVMVDAIEIICSVIAKRSGRDADRLFGSEELQTFDH